MPTLYAQVARIAQPIVKYYEGDVAIHDKGTLASLQVGDMVFWACRESGSHMVALVLDERELSPSKRREALFANRASFRSANKHWPGMQWYLLTVVDHEGHGTVAKISIKKVELLFERQLSLVPSPDRSSVSVPDRTD
jgi:hypothetical protein